MKDVKLGMVGTNFVSDWLADAVQKVDGITVSAVYSRTAEKGSDFAERHHIGSVYTDFDAFLLSEIDAVYIASPNACHAEQATAAMRHGKHVLVEKPAALCAEEFDQLTHCAKENKVVFLEAMRPAHDPVWQKVKEVIPTLGKVRRAVFEFCQYSSRYDKYKNGEILNAFNPKLGNAAVMDIGVYAIHTCVMMFGTPAAVRSNSVLFPNGMEGMGCAVLDYGDFCAEIVYSKIHDSVSPSYITGENGSVLIGKISTGENVSVKMRGSSAFSLDRDRPLPQAPESNMVYEVAAFVSAIHGELDLARFSSDTRTTLAIMDLIRNQNHIRFD